MRYGWLVTCGDENGNTLLNDVVYASVRSAIAALATDCRARWDDYEFDAVCPLDDQECIDEFYDYRSDEQYHIVHLEIESPGLFQLRRGV